MIKLGKFVLMTTRDYVQMKYRIYFLSTALDNANKDNIELKHKIDNLKACSILQAKVNNIDFPNSQKGGNGVPETPTFFPDDSNLF